MNPGPFPLEVDVAIVGSGPAGATYARILSEHAPQLRVAVFEAGPLISEPPGSHVRNIADPAARARAQRLSEGTRPLRGGAPADTMDDYASDAARLRRPGTYLLGDGWRQPGEEGLPAAAMSRNVGGMAAHWTGACPRPGDSEVIDFLPDLPGWLTEAERLLDVSADVLADAPLAGEVRRRLAAALDHDRSADRRVRAMPLAVRRNDDGSLRWAGSDVVFGAFREVYPEALVTRVLRTGDAVRGVLVRDQRDGTEHEVAARVVVVAADSLRTPQVLHASGVRPAALGRYLNDQPQIVYAVRLRDIPASTGATGISGVAWVPFTDTHPFHGQVMQLDASPVALAGDVVPGSIVGLGWFCAKDLQASDRVEFGDELDEYGMPAIRIHYTLTDRDHASLEAARTEILRAAAALGDPLDDRPPLTFPAGASLHYQGSVRMGATDDGTSVCGPDSQVWGVRGLYVAGNGVIPTATACNPTLTAVALAVGGALSIAKDFPVLDRDIIQSRGFRNVPGGFQFRLRMPNYRGVQGSLIEGVEVSVDDDLRFDRDVPRWTLQGRDFTLAELSVSTDVRWQLDEAAVITVPHPGGLRPGVHLLRVGIALQAPYIPAEFQPSVFPAERKVTILP